MDLCFLFGRSGQRASQSDNSEPNNPVVPEQITPLEKPEDNKDPKIQVTKPDSPEIKNTLFGDCIYQRKNNILYALELPRS